jgi:peptide/nickel transport system permease protein
MAKKRSGHAGATAAALRNPSFVIGAALLLAVVACAALADVIAPQGYDAVNIMEKLKQPSFIDPASSYPLGTDHIGRVLLARIVHGSRIALSVGLVAVLIETLIGVVLGLIAGYYGGKADSAILFVTDLTWAVPPVVLALAIVTVIGSNLMNVVISIAVVSWAQFTRIVRARTQALKNLPFVEAARAIGESDLSIILRYILPNVLSSIVVIGTLALPAAILSTSALSFMGLGAQQPLPDWGSILSDGINYMRKQPFLTIAPGVALAVTVLGFNLLGEGLREMLDPKLKV